MQQIFYCITWKINVGNIKNNFPDDNFMDAMDHYYSLYKKWTSDKQINEISNLVDKLIDIITICNAKNKSGDNIKHHIKQIKVIVKKMFSINTNFAIKSLLNNYELFNTIENILDIIWNNIKCTPKDCIHIFIIILAEIRVKLIKLINSAIERKNLYYNIDMDVIIKKIRNNEFTIVEFNKILNVILQNTNIIDNSIKYPIHFEDFNKHSINVILCLFKQIFNIIHKNKK